MNKIKGKKIDKKNLNTSFEYRLSIISDDSTITVCSLAIESDIMQIEIFWDKIALFYLMLALNARGLVMQLQIDISV